jgi:hypothetical protein
MEQIFPHSPQQTRVLALAVQRTHFVTSERSLNSVAPIDLEKSKLSEYKAYFLQA